MVGDWRKRRTAWRQVWWGVRVDGWRVLVPLKVPMTYIEDGGVIPLGYGIAWRDWRMDNWVCLPIGVNVIAGALRRAAHWLKTQPARDPSVLDVAFGSGRCVERECQRKQNAKWDALAAELTGIVERS